VITTALLLAWLAAALRTTGLYPRRLPFRRAAEEPPPRRDWDTERAAAVALTLVAVVFGLQSMSSPPCGGRRRGRRTGG